MPTMLDAYLQNLGDEYNVHEEAANFRLDLETNHPTLWRAYANFHWAAHFEQMIHSRLGIQRAAARKARLNLAKGKPTDNRTRDAIMGATHATANDGTVKKLLAMSKADLLHVADRYQRIADTSALEAAFLRNIASRVPVGKIVGQAWTPLAIEQEARRMFKAHAAHVLAHLDLAS